MEELNARCQGGQTFNDEDPRERGRHRYLEDYFQGHFLDLGERSSWVGPSSGLNTRRRVLRLAAAGVRAEQEHAKGKLYVILAEYPKR